MKSPILWVVALLLACLAPCQAQRVLEQPPLKLQSYQARDFDVPKERAFNATFIVFQDLGCTVSSADLQTGYITAQCPRSINSDALLAGLRHLKLTAFVLPHGKDRCRVRVTAVRTSAAFLGLWYYTPNEILVENPAVYDRLFARVLETLLTQRL